MDLNTRFLRQPAGIMFLLLGERFVALALLTRQLGILLALSLPDARRPEVFVLITFAVVVFSAVVQGLTLKRRLTFLHRPVA